MDPRIQSRRIDVMRAKGRRRLRVLLLGVTIVSLGIGGYFLSKSSLFDVDEVVIDGVSGELKEEVMKVAGIPKGIPLLEVNGSASSRRIEEISWIKEARVSRSFGGTVTIRVSTRNPVAAFENEDGWLVVDIEGRVLQKKEILPYSLVPIEGEIGNPTEGEWVPEQVIPLIQVAGTISPELSGDLSSIKGNDQIELLLFGGGKILFGDSTEVEAKVVAAETILTQVDQSSVLHIDVRAPLTPVLCRDLSCSYPST
ncbi:MAG: FtsQ-type POTRA domain-containing protein [Acidimicrobiales bacterium]|nr:FtsQ-type POTRA domain-containing protein [Acidimicrobiales bacterium]